MATNAEQVDQLRWKKFPVLDDGFVCLVDVMGDDQAVVQAARVSYGEGTRQGLGRPHADPLPDAAPPHHAVRDGRDEAAGPRADGLLAAVDSPPHGHVNEYSTRYSLAIDAMQTTPADAVARRRRRRTARGATGLLDPHVGAELIGGRSGVAAAGPRSSTKQRLELGVAREQARKDLPLSTYTEAYWKIDLHNLLHFLALRMDSHAQWEIRQYATTIGEQIVRPLFPLVWEAFVDYRLEGLFLTRLDREVIVRLVERLAGAEKPRLGGRLPGRARSGLGRSGTLSRARRVPRKVEAVAPADVKTFLLAGVSPCSMPIEVKLLELTQRLLECIAGADWETYLELCDPTLSAFEPEGRGHLIEGLDFHQYLLRPGNVRLAAEHDDVVAPRAADGRRGGRLVRAIGAIAE